MSKEKEFPPLSDQELSDLADDACELSEIKRKAESKLKPLAERLKFELKRRGYIDFDMSVDPPVPVDNGKVYESENGTPAKLVPVPKDYAKLEKMKEVLTDRLYADCVEHRTEVHLHLGKRLS